MLNQEDWRDFKELRLRALKTDPTAFGSSFEEEINLPDDEWRRKLEDQKRITYAAKILDQLVGIAGVRFESLRHVEHMATIVSVFVNPAFRGKGIGYRLMSRILEDLHSNPKIIKVRLSVNELQVAARNMYEKLGFHRIGLAEKEMRVEGKYYDQSQMELIFEDKL
ncbi:MAG: GNAT family N-acetyltransferase [bacterium]|nr:GNAT family N-acetyltransferase [bacterium]